MNIFFTLAILIANVIAILLVYQFVKKLEQMDKIIFIAISVATIYIAVSIVYWISGLGIDSRINEAVKSFIVFLFVPVNIILLVPFVANKYAKYKIGKLSKRAFVERLIKVVLIGFVLLTLECIYFRHIKKNIKTINVNIQQNSQNVINSTNTIDNTNIIENTNVTTNEIE